MRRWPTVLVVSLFLGCGAPSRPSPGESQEASCDAFIAEYREVLASATNGCAADADCARYGGLDPEAVCGGITDADTVRRLREVAAASDAAGCPRPAYSCPALAPRCVERTCAPAADGS